MPRRVGSGTPGPSTLPLEQTPKLADELRRLTASGRKITTSDVQNLVNLVASEGPQRAEQLALLSGLLESKPKAFQPEAAAALRQLLQPQENRGWSPGAASEQPRTAYREIADAFSPNAQQLADANKLGDMIKQLSTPGRTVSLNDVQGLLALVTQDRQLRPEEAALLNLMLQSRPGSFSPEASSALRQFLAPLEGRSVAVEVAPLFNKAGGLLDGNEPANIKGLRDQAQRLLGSGKKITAGDVKDLVRQALRDPETRQLALAVLASILEANGVHFSPEARIALEAFIRMRGEKPLEAVHEAAGVPEGAPTDEAGAGLPDVRGAGSPGGLFSRVVDKAKQAGLKAALSQAIRSDGEVSLSEAKRLLRLADKTGMVDAQDLQTLAQGLRENSARFSPEAAAEIEQFLARYGY